MIPLLHYLCEQVTLWSRSIPVSQRKRVHMVCIEEVEEEGRNRNNPTEKKHLARTVIRAHRACHQSHVLYPLDHGALPEP